MMKSLIRSTQLLLVVFHLVWILGFLSKTYAFPSLLRRKLRSLSHSTQPSTSNTCNDGDRVMRVVAEDDATGDKESSSAIQSQSVGPLDNSMIEDLSTYYSRTLDSSEREANMSPSPIATTKTTSTTQRPTEASSQPQHSRKDRQSKKRFWKRNNNNQRQGKLILVRCGQSEYNVNGTFTGWCDPSLTEQGVQECIHAARLLVAEGFEIDTVYTSKLKRAIKSVWIILQEMNALFLPVHKTFRLNQRHYGKLQGLNKRITAQSLGVTSVQAWRRSLKAKPPPLSIDDPTHPIHDRRYQNVPADVLPSAESLLDCQERARPVWQSKLLPDLAAGKTVLVVAHEDSLKGIIKEIDGISNNTITQQINLPKGIPCVYRFHVESMEPVLTSSSDNYPRLHVNTSGVFLEKPSRLSDLMQMQKKWNEQIMEPPLQQHQHEQQKGANNSQQHRRQESLAASVQQLRRDQNLSMAVNEIQSSEDGHNNHLHTESLGSTSELWTDDPCEFEDYDFFDVQDDNTPVVPNMVSTPIMESSSTTPLQTDAVVVLIRHGRTPHNNLGLFTGWEDPPLATDGIEDARNAGRLLRRHGFEFDVVYTSWLTRAIQTAYYVLDELDEMWIPIVKSWRLNERMYGALTGKSKKMVANEYGEEQLKKWRRGYTVRPPPVSSYSINYPGNDERKAKHIHDLPISWRESVVRSIEQRKLVLHHKFPKTESLKDCMARSIPFYTDCIRKEAVDHGKRVLITSHENAIRGILMHLCDIPQEAMNQLHLPNGLPLVYNVKGRCISLLDDDTGADPLERHDFGPAAKYLFRPCELSDELYDTMLQE